MPYEIALKTTINCNISPRLEKIKGLFKKDFAILAMRRCGFCQPRGNANWLSRHRDRNLGILLFHRVEYFRQLFRIDNLVNKEIFRQGFQFEAVCFE